MSLWRQLRYGWRGLRHRSAREQDIADELRQYFEEAEAEGIAHGLSPEDAKKAARQESGNILAARDQANEYGWENSVRILLDDLRFATRQLLKHPGFTITAILTLALGIGANSAIFTVVERVLLAPLPYRNASRLAVLGIHYEQNGRTSFRVTGPDGADISGQSQTLQAVSLYSGGTLGVQLKDHAAYATVTTADANFPRVFSLQPIAGRLFTEADAKHAVIVSEPFARDNFGSPQAAVGQTIRIEGEPRQIVGIVAEGFDFPNRTQVWLAAPTLPESKSRTAFNYKAVALLRENATFASTAQELRLISQRLQTSYEKDNRGKQMVLQPLKDSLTGSSRSTLNFLWAAAALILLIACVNVMHLELVRSMERQRELAIRQALGSSRWRVMQPVFLESLLVALAGGISGVILAFPTVKILVAMAPKELPRTGEIHPDLWVLAFTLALAMLTAILSAVLPAMRAAKIDPLDALKSDSSRGMLRHGSGLLRNGLVIAEVAATFVLAVGAGLLLRTMSTLNARDMGYDTRRLLIVDADAPAQGEPELQKAVQRFNGLFARLEHLPGVTRAAGIMGLPTGNYGSNGYYQVKDGLPPDTAHPAYANFSVASPNYFSTMRIPLKSGRDFAPQDTPESQMVAIISESLARQSFGDQDAVGRQIRCGLDSDKWMTVIGVVGDVRQDSPAEKPGPTLYMPMAQHPFYANQIHIVLRTEVPPLTLMDAVDDTIAHVDPLIARKYTTMDDMLDKSVATERFRAILISSFAGMGLLLAVLGVYGTVAYSMTQRKFEFGIRVAFGAERHTILWSVLSQAARMAALGIVIGLALSLALARLVESMLVGVRPNDPVSLALVSALILAAALAAALGPGWRATRVDPMIALRAE